MSTQLEFFEANYPDGFRYLPELITVNEESELVRRITKLPFREFEFHGFLGKRRTVSFGWKYDYSGRALRKADDIPDFLFDLRARAGSFAGMDSETFQHVLVTEYRPGSGIGWHRDKPEFGEVVGISLLSPCVLRFRRKLDMAPTRRKSSASSAYSTSSASPRFETVSKTYARPNWDRVNINIDSRSAYHLGGPARWDWYHSILRVDSLRYAVTFRNVKESAHERQRRSG